MTDTPTPATGAAAELPVVARVHPCDIDALMALADRYAEKSEEVRDQEQFTQPYQEARAERDAAREALRTLLASLAQPADLARDAARLDWLESDGCTQVFKIGNRWYTRAAYHMPHRRAVTLRAAIDAAIQSATPGEPQP